MHAIEYKILRISLLYFVGSLQYAMEDTTAISASVTD